MISFLLGLLVGAIVGTLVTLNNQKDVTPVANKVKTALDVNKDGKINLTDAKDEATQIKKKVTRKKAK